MATGRNAGSFPFGCKNRVLPDGHLCFVKTKLV